MASKCDVLQHFFFSSIVSVYLAVSSQNNFNLQIFRRRFKLLYSTMLLYLCSNKILYLIHFYLIMILTILHLRPIPDFYFKERCLLLTIKQVILIPAVHFSSVVYLTVRLKYTLRDAFVSGALDVVLYCETRRSVSQPSPGDRWVNILSAAHLARRPSGISHGWRL